MSKNTNLPARQMAPPSAQGATVAHVRLLAWFEVLVLALLLRLPGPLLAGAGADRARRLLLRRTASLAAALAPDAAPHAAVVALGLVPDWILPAHPGRGMRRVATPRPHARIPATARAPPGAFCRPVA